MNFKFVPIICVVVVGLLCLSLWGLPDDLAWAVARLYWPQLLFLTVAAFGVGGLLSLCR